MISAAVGGSGGGSSSKMSVAKKRTRPMIARIAIPPAM
jgi:hypothetical protein